ncbi:MAG: hypothetical protein AB8H86_10070 [Polyangiales bacterium]
MRFAVYLCVFGVLGGCHAFIDPEDDYLRPEDAGTPPMDDAGPPPGDVFDAGLLSDVDGSALDAGPQCTNVGDFNRVNSETLIACCIVSSDCPPPPGNLPPFGCVDPACPSHNAGVCLPVGLLRGDRCRANGQCVSGVCMGGQAMVACGERVGILPGECQ